MAGIVINDSKCVKCGLCVNACPFKALELKDKVEVNASCKMCKVCIKTCPVGAISLEEEKKELIDKSLYNDILVYIEHDGKMIHPVSLELIGKGLELAKVNNEKVNALLIGNNVSKLANDLLYTGVSKVFVYDDAELETFRVDNYANAFEDIINETKPSVCLVGATTTGRSLAPRVACRFKTGLTADCTILEMRENKDLVQIRPAFGGNIMAQIINTNNRPQFATVRYKVMDAKPLLDSPSGEIVNRKVTDEIKKSSIKLLEVIKQEKSKSITDADILVVAGQGVKDEKGLALVKELASLLNGMVAFTRPMVEKGVATVQEQIGLSGRTVKPKLIITCGVSGAIQFVAGMNQSETIVSINSDPNAQIFNVAHYAIVDDLYPFLTELINTIKGAK